MRFWRVAKAMLGTWIAACGAAGGALLPFALKGSIFAPRVPTGERLAAIEIR
jgi:hypothetical protein